MDIKIVQTKADDLGISPDELIALIVAKQHFSNHESVVDQNIGRFHHPERGGLPDYIIRYCGGCPIMSEMAVA